MKAKKTVLALVVLLAGSIVAESALAGHRGPRVSFGFSFGAPYYAYPYYAPYPYYYPRYYPAPVVVERAPVYVEQAPAPAPAPAQPQAQPQSQSPAGFWYYCNESGAYYPYVQECAGGWQRVAPQP
jgi:hypothetical protein